ncbi:HNH endonuclease [Escherichia coli]|uniref:HNH endonuclease n=1 Tax=Escherichia coli TaxID=562 RepID=UPI001F1324D2|nr:HNH endonuclease [Escherichia coli]MCH6215816.1 HNH endonuclease [Escherichia coli]MCH6485905.1 HNH endonuclease [Escherichia coli]
MFAKIDEGMVFMRKRKYQTWNHWGKESEFVRMVAGGYWEEITAAEAGDLKYADCSKCAENWPELFDYHPDGYLISKVARGYVKPGDIIRGAVNKYNKNKCRQIGLNGNIYHLHRIVYEMFNGPIPDGYVIENNDDSCVKIENLKLISRSECGLKRKINTTSGIQGVHWKKTRNKWETRIKAKQVHHYLGLFDNINDAIKARINGEIRYYGKQINDFPDYISPDEEERIKQRYYEGEEMKQIEINTESHEHEQELPRAFKYHGHDVRVNEADEINLIDIAAAMGVVNEDDLRHRIDSLNKLPGYIYCTEQYDMQIDKGYAPFEIAGMVAARIGAEKDRIDLSLAFHKFKNDRISAAIAQHADSNGVEELKAELAALKQENSGQHATISQLLADKVKAEEASKEQTLRDSNAVAKAQQKVEDLEDEKGLLSWQLKEAREARDSYHSRIGYWVKQYKQANKAFSDEQSKRRRAEKERDNAIQQNMNLRRERDGAKAAADKQTLLDLNEARKELDRKDLVITGYQLTVADLEGEKRNLQNDLNVLHTGYDLLSERYNKLIARILQRRAAQKRYMGDLKQRQQRNHERYRKLIMALRDKVKELLYRLDKKPEGGFFNKVKSLFHH